MDKQRIDLFKFFWIFVMGSVFGFIVETIWCFYRHGSFQMRSSMVIGPFTVIYGIGALVLYMGLSRTNNILYMVIFGAVAGAAIEFFASYLQETVVGSVSWDYSAKPFNIGGRICLLYSFYWGALAVMWRKLIQPVFEKLIVKIPSGMYRPLTIGLSVFIVADIVISIIAVARWGMRLDGIPPAGIITTTIDSVFPNRFMEVIYPNMIW